MKSIKSDNYIVIQGWMITELGLSGNELVVYATIYGFSQVEGHFFKGDDAYLATWANVHKKTIQNILNSLISKALITKTAIFDEDGRMTCKYAIVPRKAIEERQEEVEEEEEDTEEETEENISNLEKFSKMEKISDIYNNYYSSNTRNNNNNKNNNNQEKDKKEFDVLVAEHRDELRERVDFAFPDLKVRQALYDYIDYRLAVMKSCSYRVFTVRQLEILLTSLKQLANNNEDWVTIVHAAIASGAMSFFLPDSLKRKSNKKTEKQSEKTEKLYGNYE